MPDTSHSQATLFVGLQPVPHIKPNSPTRTTFQHPTVDWTLLDMIPDRSQAYNLPSPVKLLAAVIHHEIKNETGIKTSMITTANAFGPQEKSLRQAMKGAQYKSGSQKCRHESAACDKEEESSSSEEDDDDNDDDSAVTKIKPLTKHHKKK